MSGTCLFRMKASTLLLVMMKERSCVIIQVRFEWLMKTLSLSLFPLFKALQSGDLLKNDHMAAVYCMKSAGRWKNC